MRAKIVDHLFILEILSKDGQTRTWNEEKVPLSLSLSTKNKVSASSESILLLQQRYLEKVANQLHALTTDRRINCL